MKIIFFLISFMLIISCSNKKSFNNKESLVDEITVKEYSSNSVVKEKFLEFYDLNILLENNPQFTENIKERLNHFKLDSSKVLYLQKTSKIKDIKINIEGADSFRVTKDRLIVSTQFGDFSEKL